MSDLERLDDALDDGVLFQGTADEVDRFLVIEAAARAYRDLLANGQRVEWCEEHQGVRAEGNINCWAAQTLWRSGACRIVSKLLAPSTEESVYPKEAENES